MTGTSRTAVNSGLALAAVQFLLAPRLGQCVGHRAVAQNESVNPSSNQHLCTIDAINGIVAAVCDEDVVAVLPSSFLDALVDRGQKTREQSQIKRLPTTVLADWLCS